MQSNHIERHRAHRIGWLRAAVLGANDAVVSVSGPVVDVAAGDEYYSNNWEMYRHFVVGKSRGLK